MKKWNDKKSRPFTASPGGHGGHGIAGKNFGGKVDSGIERIFRRAKDHGRMARGGHGFPKVSLGPAMPDPFRPCRWAILETAVFYPFGHPTPYAYD
jgi:hypothetical protein